MCDGWLCKVPAEKVASAVALLLAIILNDEYLTITYRSKIVGHDVKW